MQLKNFGLDKLYHTLNISVYVTEFLEFPTVCEKKNTYIFILTNSHPRGSFKIEFLECLKC